jgi:hypothetical protein
LLNALFNNDFIKDAAVIKVGFLCALPATKYLIYGDQLHLRKLIGVLCGNLRIARAVVIARGNFLTFGGIKTLQIGGCYFTSTFFSTTLSTTATGGSAKIEIDGVTISYFSGPSYLTAKRPHFPKPIKHHQCRVR